MTRGVHQNICILTHRREGLEVSTILDYSFTFLVNLYAAGARIPVIDIDKLQLVMYKFFDLCEANELTASVKKVEKKIQELFAWSQVLVGTSITKSHKIDLLLQVSNKIWGNYFARMKREHKDCYTFPEFFGIYLAVESGEFLSTGDPDAYSEPGERKCMS